MNESMKDIQALVDRLASLPQSEQGVETQALALLIPLQRALETRNTPAVARLQALLKTFWLQRVPWCASLSREIEKLLILLEELSSTPPAGPFDRHPFDR